MNVKALIEEQMLLLAQEVASDMANFMRSNEMPGLSQSVQGKISNEGDKIVAYIEMREYGKYLLLGVRGAKESSRAPSSPFSFKKKMPPIKMPPIKPLEEWITTKSIKMPNGKPLSPFALSRSIFNRGLSPKANFILPVWNEKVAEKYKEKIQQAIGAEIEAVIYT